MGPLLSSRTAETAIYSIFELSSFSGETSRYARSLRATLVTTISATLAFTSANFQ
jgi:hypothetical protein